MNLKTIVFFASTILLVQSLIAQQSKSESPYFLVNNTENINNSFPLKSNKAKVIINGPIADIKIQQVYQNKTDQPIEATYVFPASTRAAIYHMEMHIGKRIIKAEIQRKAEARKTYENAKNEGKRTSLLEQHRPNVFQMNVANIMPGDEIEVYLYYTEFIVPEHQEYTFHYPTVVGPRYTGEQAETWAAQPYTKSGIDPSYHFDLQVELNTSVPIQSISSQSHQIDIIKKGLTQQFVKLSKIESKGGNRDFILKYSLSGNKIETGIQTYSNGKENFFLCQIEAPHIKTNPAIVPREYVFIMDISGSMRGFPLDVSKELMKDLLSRLNPTDKFNILFFAGSAFALSSSSIDATPNNIKYAMKEIHAQSGGGGTNMLNAIKKSMAIPKDEDYSRSYVIITDGYVTVGPKAFHYINSNLDKANFFAFGIGSSVNRQLIEGVAHAGKGQPFIVTDKKSAKMEAKKLKSYIEFPMLTSINIVTEGIDIYEVSPSKIPDLMGERPIFIFGKYKNYNNPSITITGMKGCNHFSQKLDFPEKENGSSNLEYLWARETIKHLEYENYFNATNANTEAITKLGLKHNLLTEYTSFVAVDDQIANSSGTVHKVKQPLPMPQDVSNYAVGFEMELPSLTHEDNPKVIDISVKSNNKTHEKILESILEIHLKEKRNIMLFVNQNHISLRFDAQGKLWCDEGNLSRSFLIAIEESLKKLGVEIRNEIIEINIIKK